MFLGGRAAQRDRAVEFDDQQLMADSVHRKWRELEPRLDDALRNLPDSALSTAVSHPRRGELSGFEVLIVALRHAAEHMGQAELTRELVLAQRATGWGVHNLVDEA